MRTLSASHVVEGIRLEYEGPCAVLVIRDAASKSDADPSVRIYVDNVPKPSLARAVAAFNAALKSEGA